MNRPFKRRWLILAAIPIVGLCLGALAIDSFGHAQQPRPSDVIIVLGSGVLPNGKASNSLRERVMQAVALQRAGLAPVIICTGGVGDNPPAEAIVAADLARKLGAPGAQVLAEDKSTSTRENARFAARICREHNWRSAIIVSQPYHLWRARLLFGREGLQVSGSAVPDPIVDKSIWQRGLWSLREAVLGARDLVW